MNKAEVGTDNIYFEMDTKNGTEARTYDEATDKSDIPATKRESIERSAQESKKKRQPTKETGTVAFRPIQLIAAALVAVAFLTAVATLVLALTMMLSQNSLTASKDSDPDVYGANLTSELKEIKENHSYIHSLVLAELENLRTRMNKIEGSISSANCNKSNTSSDRNQVVNTTKTPGSKGPPGYNGTQGPAGPPGPPGSGDVTHCSYVKGSSSPVTPDNYAESKVEIAESKGKKFLGVNCDSNDAKFVKLSSSFSGGKGNYTCSCESTLNSADAHMYCYIHYWECLT